MKFSRVRNFRGFRGLTILENFGPVWKAWPIWGRSSGCRVDLGRVHRVQGRSGPCAPGAMSLMPYASGCNTLHALYIRVQCPAFMPCTSGCMDEREYIYAIAPRTHDQSSLCLCAGPLHLFPAKKRSVCLSICNLNLIVIEVQVLPAKKKSVCL